jgi:hypothetical protein
MNRKQLILILILVLVAAVALSGCADRNSEEDTEGSDGVAGFWSGLWHGLILPVAFVISLFDDGVGIYEIHNNGNLYNLGFVLGTWFVFGSLLAGSQSSKSRVC